MTLDEAIARLNDEHRHEFVLEPGQLEEWLTELKEAKRLLLTDKEISNIQITWRTFSFPEIKSKLQELYHSDMSFLDLVSALYWDLIETKHKYYRGSVKFGNNRATLEEIAELKDELSGWQDDPFSIIAEVCETNTDCKNCLWFEKCPFKDYGEYPNDWRKG